MISDFIHQDLLVIGRKVWIDYCSELSWESSEVSDWESV